MPIDHTGNYSAPRPGEGVWRHPREVNASLTNMGSAMNDGHADLSRKLYDAQNHFRQDASGQGMQDEYSYELTCRLTEAKEIKIPQFYSALRDSVGNIQRDYGGNIIRADRGYSSAKQWVNLQRAALKKLNSEIVRDGIELRPANSNEETIGQGRWPKHSLRNFALLVSRHVISDQDHTFPSGMMVYVNGKTDMRFSADEMKYIKGMAYMFLSFENAREVSTNEKIKMDSYLRTYARKRNSER